MRYDRLHDADQLLSAVAIVPISEQVLEAAEAIPPGSVATLDAIHLARAVELAADGVVEAVMTHGAGLARGARQHGLEVLTPTA